MAEALDRFWAMLVHAKSRSGKLGEALCGLVVEGAKLGELERREVIGIDGERREIRVPPAIWFDRLVAAAEAGAFERLEVNEIVARILVPLDDAQSRSG
jgi:hypothetical protein